MVETCGKPTPEPWRLALAGPAAVAAVALAAWLIRLMGERVPAGDSRALAGCIATALAAFGVFAGLIKRSTRQVLLGLYSGIASGAVFLAVFGPAYAITENGLAIGAAGLAGLVAAWTAFGAGWGWAEGGAPLLCTGLRSGFLAAIGLIPVLFISVVLGELVLSPLLQHIGRNVEEVICYVWTLAPSSYIAAYIFFSEFHRRPSPPPPRI